MPEVDHVSDGIVYFVDGSYYFEEAGTYYDANGQEVQFPGTAEAAGETGREETPGVGQEVTAEPTSSDVPMGEPEPEQGQQLDAQDSGEVGSDSGEQAETVESDVQTYEGVTSSQFDEYSQMISAKLDFMLTCQIVIVIALFMCAGIAAIDTLVRSLERF
jgi:hypothetical protein